MSLLRSLFFLIILVSLTGAATAQDSLNLSRIGHLAYSESINEVRGCVHNGREYALVGVRNGLSIVDVSDPTAPVEVFFEAGPSSTWRDPFYHDGYAYCVTEGGGGMLIVDMGPLPAVTTLPTSYYTGTTYPFQSAHNMFIDTIAERAYLFGTDTIGGTIIVDVSDPENPSDLGVWDDRYIHDGFVRGDTLWAGCLSHGAYVVDVSTPTNPVVLANWATPSQFAHNIWPSDDNGYAYTTDEVSGGFVAAFNVSDLANVVETDRVREPLSEGSFPHNTHYYNDYVVTSYYRDGVSIHDVSDPENVVLTGYYDTSPLMSGTGTNGNWGAWPYLPSGNLLVSDRAEGLFILGPSYKRAARLEGTVSDFETGSPLSGVTVSIDPAGSIDSTDLFGEYATGLEAGGTYSVTFEKGGYLPQTHAGIELINGQTVVLDAQLVSDIPFVLSGQVTDDETGDPIEGATVQIVNEFFDLEYTTDTAGNYVDSAFFAGQYEVAVGAWGYIGDCMTLSADSAVGLLDFQLDSGYHDDFSLDLGWSVSGNATTGIWERDHPIGTTFEGTPANPGTDALGDCGGQAFVTGNAGEPVNMDDVDDGMTILTSPPMALSNLSTATIRFKYWFFNDGGDGSPNDELIVKIDNGTEVVTVGSLPTTLDAWTDHAVVVEDHLTATDQVRLILEIQDTSPGHLVEGGIDRFQVVSTTGIGNGEEVEVMASVYPNPAKDFINISVNREINTGSVRIWDVAGKLVHERSVLKKGSNRIAAPITSGLYLCEVVVNDHRVVKRLSVHK